MRTERGHGCTSRREHGTRPFATAAPAQIATQWRDRQVQRRLKADIDAALTALNGFDYCRHKVVDGCTADDTITRGIAASPSERTRSNATDIACIDL